MTVNLHTSLPTFLNQTEPAYNGIYLLCTFKQLVSSLRAHIPSFKVNELKGIRKQWDRKTQIFWLRSPLSFHLMPGSITPQAKPWNLAPIEKTHYKLRIFEHWLRQNLCFCATKGKVLLFPLILMWWRSKCMQLNAIHLLHTQYWNHKNTYEIA